MNYLDGWVTTRRAVYAVRADTLPELGETAQDFTMTLRTAHSLKFANASGLELPI